MRYDIADFIPEDARRWAAVERYDARCPLLHGGLVPSNQLGCCPLGVVLRVLGKPHATRPSPAAIATALEPPITPHYSRERWEAIQLAAHRFMADFDADRIADVAEALGVADG